MMSTTDPDEVKSTLQRDGAVLIRGVEATREDFEKLSDALMAPMVHQATGTVERDRVNKEGTTSTVNKGKDYVPYHREGSYAPGCPHLLMFYCEQPAAEGGQTTLCDGVLLREALSESSREFIDNAKLKWLWKAQPDRWQATLGTDDKEDALTRLQGLQNHLPEHESIEAEFDGDVLDGIFRTPCVMPTRWGGHKGFCNSVMIYHYRKGSDYFAKSAFELRLDDDSPFPQDVLEEIYAESERLTEEVEWQPGDVLLVDNSRFMHGRRAFDDPNRHVLIRMGYLHPESA
jgi:alpha-ketoglutarate-dependent taurine dioxygenase